MKKIVGFILLVLAILVVVFRNSLFPRRPVRQDAAQSDNAANQTDLYPGVSYAAVDPSKFDVSVISKALKSPTRIRITPDGKFLLVTQLTGEVMGFSKTPSGWKPFPSPVVTVETRFPGFPPDEAGLVNIIFSNHFSENGKVFLLYSYKDSDGNVQNRISVSVLSLKNGVLEETTPQRIFQANVSGNPSHQITDGEALDILGKPHLLFLIGEGFHSERAQDPSQEGGKLMLIQEDGSDPLGSRPFPQDPKVQALGIRNAFVLVQNPFDSLHRVMIADTGPDHFDRLIYALPVDPSGKALRRLNFNWDGNEDKLKTPIQDPNFPRVKDMVILRLPDTRTFTGLIFHPGGGAIPQSTQASQSVLATMFGKTGWKDNQPGKEIWLGTLTNLTGQPKISFEPIIRRIPESDGKLGNPIGLELDPQTGDFFFADIMEGRLYQVKIRKGGEL